jgi:hypothetical protein
MFCPQLGEPGALPCIADLRLSALEGRRVVPCGLGGLNLWAAPCLTQLTRLCVQATSLPPAAGARRAGAGAAALAALQELRIDVQQSGPALDALAAFGLPRLRALAISDEPRGTEAAARASLAALLSTGLQSLEIRYRGRSAAVEVLKAADLPALTRLVLNGPLGDEAAMRRLFDSRWVPGLRHLALDFPPNQARTDEARRALGLACERVVRLECLAIRSIHLSIEDCAALLAKAPHLSALTSLDVRLRAPRDCFPSFEALAALRLPRLGSLYLCHVGVSAGGLRALGRAPWLGQLSRLVVVAAFDFFLDMAAARRAWDDAVYPRCPVAVAAFSRLRGGSSSDDDAVTGQDGDECEGAVVLGGARRPPAAHMPRREASWLAPWSPPGSDDCCDE